MVRPILFNTDMVRALLAERKTVTRRVVKPQPASKLAYVCMGHKHGTWSYPSKDAWKYWEDESFRLPDGLPDEERARRWVPPCHTGDILYVQETFFKDGDEFFYKADDKLADLPSFRESTKMIYRPSIHMPREAARIFLRVTDVRVERLQDITEEQAEREGCEAYMEEFEENGYWEPATLDFIDTWNSTIKPADRALYGWEANPWVWVIEFEQCRKPEGFI